MNRDFLRYQEGMLTRREFIKTMVNDGGEAIFDNERGCLREAYRREVQSHVEQGRLEYIDEQQERRDQFVGVNDISEFVKDDIEITEIKDEERNMKNIEKNRMNKSFNKDKYINQMKVLGKV